MKTAWLLIMLTLPLAACGLWNDYKHPLEPVPGAWNTNPDVPGPYPDVDWWKKFGSDTLNAQIEQAKKENFDLQAAVARVRQADAQLKIAGAALLPAIDASGNAQRDRTPGGRVGPSGISSKPKIANTFNAQLNASYEIDFWGKNWSAAESARALAQGSRYDQQTVELTTLASVADTYFDILATQERLKVAHDNLDAAQQVLDAFKKRFDLGVATGLDVAQQESIVEAQKAAIPPLDQRLRQDLDAQAVLLGKLPETVQMPADKLDSLTIPAVGAGLPSELLERRPDVQSAEAQLVSANANIINARAAFFPSISLTAAGGYESGMLNQLLKPDSMLWSLAASAAQPIFEGGALTGQLEFAHAKYDEMLQDYRKSVVAAFADTEDSLVAVQQTASAEQAQKEAVDTAKHAYDLAKQQFDGGITDITTLLNTQRTLFSAQDAYLQARLSHLQAIVSLYKSLGGGWKNGTPVYESTTMG